MASQFIDWTAPSLQGRLPKKPQDLPHGRVTPPQEVVERVRKDKANYPPHVYTPEAEERILNEWTLQYYFDYLGYEVTYRRTPQGPEILAVGDDERFALRQRIGEEAFGQLQSYLRG